MWRTGGDYREYPAGDVFCTALYFFLAVGHGDLKKFRRKFGNGVIFSIQPIQDGVELEVLKDETSM